ncbi:uncharacterized protein [Zea mays]|uniref:uncharacterized protein isoform X1 n=1 Tax=Zea mays TaxID=4577 RepID=UPI0004DEA9C7|nr:uncharacterized protein LOC103651598 isoform X1 [Zea mays]|eukprot:XP_008675482.1 uncharacterized protein LOC103651598 isoform X1 [Zea mays]
MHRSSSYYLQQSSSSSSSVSSSSLAATGGAASPGPSSTAGVMDVDQLPTYDPRSDVAKKEALDASRADLARALVHLIPVGVLLCGLLLWSFSDTDFPAEDGVLLEKGEGRMAVAGVRIMPRPRSSVTMEKGGDGRTTEDSDPVGKAHGTNKRRVLLRSEMEHVRRTI